MAFQVSPGVNVSEVDLTTIVPAVSTTVAGIAGQFDWGPANTAILISNEKELADTFSVPGANSHVAFMTAASFLAYGNALYVSRGLSGSNTGYTSRNATTNSANTADTIIKNAQTYDDDWGTGRTGVGPFVAKWAGDLGNSLLVSTCASSNAWSSTLTGNVTFTNGSTAITGNGTQFTTEVQVGDTLVLGPDKRTRRVASITSATALTLASTYTGNTGTSNGNTERRWRYFNEFDRAPGTSVFAANFSATNDEMHVIVIDEDGEITGTPGQVVEKYSAVSQASDALTEDGSTNYYKEVINRKSRWIWWAAHDDAYSTAGYRAKGGQAFTGAGLPQTDSFVNGRDGNQLTGSELISAYSVYQSKEDIDLSIIMMGDANATVTNNVIQNIAEVRKDLVVTTSPERADVVDNIRYAGSQRDDIVTHRNTLPSTSYAIMDSGWKYMYDKYNDLYRWIPLNGDVAGSIVRTDLDRDPWYSPAGFNRGHLKNVVKLAYNPGQADRDFLYRNGVNPIVTFPGQGTVLYGDKTLLAKPSAFDRINVRRLFIVLEKAISLASQYTLFEFNDDFTRAQFRNLVEPFLRDIQGRRGITDFRVVCDETNNTPEVIDRNEFIGDIYIKPARSINFIQLNFVAVRTGVNFNEIVGQF
jgi:phage tail sheath protein FI